MTRASRLLARDFTACEVCGGTGITDRGDVILCADCRDNPDRIEDWRDQQAEAVESWDDEEEA